MADLDDFFAKKDKKRGKKKFTSDELKKPEPATNAESKAESGAAKKKERPAAQNEGGTVEKQQEEDEWKEIKEYTGPDLSGLKIKILATEEDDENYDGADGEPVEGEVNSGVSGDPWKKGGGPAVNPAVGNVAAASNEPQVYISPTVRNAARLRKGIAPDLSNESYFPSLGSADKPAVGGSKKGASFEEIKHGARPVKQSQGNAPVEVANRFNSLSSDLS